MPDKETIERKMERLLPSLHKSLDVFHSERPIEEAAVTVTRTLKGETQTLAHLVVCGINADGPEFATIDANGDPTNSATMLWIELIDVTSEQ